MSNLEPSKANGQFNSIVGSGKEVLGNAIEQVYAAVGGSQEPSQFTVQGKEQHSKGEAEIKAAEAKAYTEGLGDRLEGKKDSIVGAVTGDKAQQASGNLQNDKGQAKMSANS